MTNQPPTTSSNTSEGHLKKDLGNRHIQLIAIGGAIGTGLFMGSGKTISLAGPSILLVYAIIGFFLFLMMRCLGELMLANPSFHTFSDLAGRYMGVWGGFLVSWTYWLCWIVSGTADLIAISGYFQFWWPELNPGIPVVCTIAVLFLLNTLTVKAFGEAEFWFSMIKIVAILALIVVGLYLLFTGHVNPSGTPARVSNLWAYGGIFPNGFGGFITGFQIALFAFVGIELVGAAVGETKDPTESLPKAVNAIPIRVVLFYLGALSVIMMVTPWNEIVPENSPFVTMFTFTGLPAAASVINLVVITAAASSANSGIYSTSRMVYGLANAGAAPKLFGGLSKRHVPQSALTLSCAFLFTSLILLIFGDSIIGAFTLATTMAAALFMVVWGAICWCYIRYRKEEPEKHAQSIFPVPGAAPAAWSVLVFFGLMVIVLLSAADTAPGIIAAIVWVIICSLLGKRFQNRHPEIVWEETVH